MQVKGFAHRYGSNVDTDVIIPARYLNTSSHAELARHCMEDIDPEFAAKVKDGDLIVAGENFGCGSSREHAPIAIKASGISCVIAKSFARIFYRNAINIGLPIMECPDAAEAIKDGDRIAVDFDAGTIINETRGTSYQAEPFPPFILDIIRAGGLINSIKEAK
jgi:3-isopropylmalate/(R)-2-methylmalate dehydratase small subunit